jgi:peptidoglycan hydrolase CwlO-like protein
MKILIEEKLKNIAFKCTQSIGSVWSLIIHTTLFIISFLLYFLGFELNSILLILTTIVSLEAIYLSIFIQMSVNLQAQKLHDVAEDVEEMQEDVEEMQEDINEINEEEEDDDDSDLLEIKITMKKLMSEFGSLKKQLKKIEEGVEEINEDEDDEDDSEFLEIKDTMKKLMSEVVSLKNSLKNKK